MSFSYDISTPVGQVRFLTGDTNSAAPRLADEELAGAISMEMALNGTDQPAIDIVLFAAADALETQAGKLAALQGSVTLGDYETSSADQVKSLQAAAQALRDRVNNTPAFAVIDENLSRFNELTIIRNWMLRNYGGGVL